MNTIISELYPNSSITEIDRTGFGIIKVGTKRILLFVKEITGEIAFYNLSISKNTFGAELIHENDFKKIQTRMKETSITHCVYLIHSVDKGIFSHQYTFPFDENYIRFLFDNEEM